MTSRNPVSGKAKDLTDNQSDFQVSDLEGIPTYSSASNQIITEYGKQNMFASEPQMQYVENYQGYWINAEQLNGRLAMIGFFAAVHNYILTGYVIPGIW